MFKLITARAQWWLLTYIQPQLLLSYSLSSLIICSNKTTLCNWLIDWLSACSLWTTPCFPPSGPAPSSEPKLIRAPLWHRWGTGAGQDTDPCGQAVLQEPGGPQWEIQGACGVCHQCRELHEADESRTSVTSSGGGGKLNTWHLFKCDLHLLCLESFSLYSLDLRCLPTRWCCPTVLCECLPRSTKCVCWCRDRVLWWRSLTSILS